MRIAHLADLHVGFRQFARSNPKGANQREADVADALHRVLDDVIATTPDAVLLAGDLFHSVRPTNGAILTMFSEMQRLRAALPSAAVVAIAGNHDTPRTVDAGSILGLYRALGVTVVQTGIERIPVGHGCVVTAVPSSAAHRMGEVAPDPQTEINVLLAHGEARGYKNAASLASSVRLDAAGEEAIARPWDYVALGDYHVCVQVGPRAWYSGSLDYVSSDPWGEIREQAARGLVGKGWLSVDLPGGEPQFHPVSPIPRAFFDLPPVDCAGMDPKAIDGAIAVALATVPLDGAVVRLILQNVSKIVGKDLNHAAIREYRGRALHFQLDQRRPSEEAPTAERRAAKFQSLDERVEMFLRDRELTPDLDREQFVAVGMAALRRTEE